MRIKNKRAISPVIATVLLIAIAVALFVVIFFWVRGFQKEAITKFGASIENYCTQIQVELEKQSNTLEIKNVGQSITIYRAKIYAKEGNGFVSKGEIGPIYSGTSSTFSPATAECYKVVPVLLGLSGGKQKVYVCDKNPVLMQGC